MSLKSKILSVTRRTKKGFTVGEIFDRVHAQLTEWPGPAYSTVRARVYELAASGELFESGVRKDCSSGREATTFRRSY